MGNNLSEQIDYYFFARIVTGTSLQYFLFEFQIMAVKLSKR
jgi:hypothetical protein